MENLKIAANLRIKCYKCYNTLVWMSWIHGEEVCKKEEKTNNQRTINSLKENFYAFVKLFGLTPPKFINGGKCNMQKGTYSDFSGLSFFPQYLLWAHSDVHGDIPMIRSTFTLCLWLAGGLYSSPPSASGISLKIKLNFFFQSAYLPSSVCPDKHMLFLHLFGGTCLQLTA